MADAEKKFTRVGQLKEGGYVLIDEIPCQIKSVEKSKPGKHGAAKARVTAIGVFNNAKKTLLKSTGMDAEVPMIRKGSAQVVAVMGDLIQIMDLEDYSTKDIKNPKEIAGLASGVEVEFIAYGDELKVVRKR
ncbi:MAG TPA: translation initiation factor IF-5A [archaeon]|nr:translation initiation factor IF-5A [archaeon]